MPHPLLVVGASVRPRLRNAEADHKKLQLRTALPGLDRRTRRRAVGTEHAAIAREWLELLAAALACIKVPTGVGRHLFRRTVPALGASQNGFDLHLDSVGSAAVTVTSAVDLKFLSSISPKWRFAQPRLTAVVGRVVDRLGHPRC